MSRTRGVTGGGSPHEPAGQLAHTSTEGARASLRARIDRWAEESLARMGDADLRRMVTAQSGAETAAELLAAEAGSERTPGDWGELLLRGAAARRAIAHRLGGLLTSTQAAEVAGVSVQAIKQRLQRRQMLAVQVGGGQWGIPALQFDRSGQVRDGVPDVRSMAEESGLDPWTLLSILADPADGDGDRDRGRTLLEALDDPAVCHDLCQRIVTYGTHGTAC